MKRDNKLVGRRGEQEAEELLRRKGYTVITKNYGDRWGEVDIVAREEDVVVFVEVKTKRGDEFGEPWEMVSATKIMKVKQVGQRWCEEFDYHGLCRVDVVGVWMNEGGELEKIEHWENVEL